MEAKRDCRLVSVLIVSLSLSFTSGCASLNTVSNRSLSQPSVEPDSTSKTKKYVNVICKLPALCCISYEQTENNKKNEVGICIGM